MSALPLAQLQAVMGDPRRRAALVEKIKSLPDIQLPALAYWNYSLCRKHRHGWVEEFPSLAEAEFKGFSPPAAQVQAGPPFKRTVTSRPAPGCRSCGIHHRKHQRVGALWMFLKGRGLLADSVGTGKTIHGASLIALMKEAGELEKGKAIVIPRAPALLQWARELNRMVPMVSTVTVSGMTRAQRMNAYASGWEVLVISPQMLINDLEVLSRNFNISLVLVDDVDSLRNPETKQSHAIRALAKESPRYMVMTGTPLQKRLHELYNVLEPMGAREVFGPPGSFKRRYVREEKQTIYDNHRGKKRIANKVVGYKNLEEFKTLVAPFALRRTAADIDDVDLPAVIANDVELELYPRQRAKYKELQGEVLHVAKADGTAQSKRLAAMSKLIYGAQICAGLASLGEPDEPETSVKMDWLLDKLTGDLEGEKVVVFALYKNTIRALHKRMDDAGIKYVTVWGEEPDKAARQRAQDQFWEDPHTKVLLGTQAIEQSLNLQIARHLVNVDMIMNPARMEQLSGRIRRDGSAFKHVYVHNLLTMDTQEERYLPLLRREQSLINFVWDDSSELFAQLDPMQMLHLISG